MVNVSQSPTCSFVAIAVVLLLSVNLAICGRCLANKRRRSRPLGFKPLPLIIWTLILSLTGIRVEVVLQSSVFGACWKTSPFVHELITTNDVAVLPRFTCRGVRLVVLLQSPLFCYCRLTSAFVRVIIAMYDVAAVPWFTCC